MADPYMESYRVSSTRRPVEEQEIDLYDYLVVVWQRRWMILALCLIAMGVAVTMALLTPRRYRSRATIMPPMEMLQRRSSLAGDLGAWGNSMLREAINTREVSDIYVEILNSRLVADTIIDRFDLMHVYKNRRRRPDVRKQLKRNTEIETTEAGAVKIVVTDRDPNRAAAMANMYVEELDRQNKRLSAGQATSKRIFLETRLREVEDRLSSIENILSREAKVQETLYELLVHEYEIAKIEEAKSMPTIQVLDEAVVPELPVARGTIKKGMMAGIAALMFGVFLAFACEHVAAVKGRSVRAATMQQRSATVLAGTPPKPAKADAQVTAVPKKRARCGEPDSNAVESTPSV